MVQKKMKKKSDSLKKCPAVARVLVAHAQKNKPGYDFILLVSLPSYQAKPIEGKLSTTYANMYRRDTAHQQALMQAVQSGIYHYEWSVGVLQKSVWFQTTCVALPRPDGKISEVLCLSRDISQLGKKSLVNYTGLQEGATPKTFAQILLTARETERKKISKALHDEVGSSSVILMALLSLVKMDIKKGNTKRALRDLEQLDGQIKQSIERLRSIIVSLRPPTLDNAGGLCAAVRDLLEQISTLSHIPYQFQCRENDEIALSENVRILLFRIVQEALTNIVKHARAKRMEVSIKQRGNNVYLQVRDDGIGFDPKQSVSIAHVGLLAMKDSVELLGGKLLIKSAPGKGTRIEVECPQVVYGGEE